MQINYPFSCERSSSAYDTIPCISLAVPAVIFKISPSSKTSVCDIICRVVFEAIAALSILNVADALVSVTCVAKFTAALHEPL